MTWYLAKTFPTPIAKIYYIGGLVTPLQGSDILPENPGMEIHQIKTFANSVCYTWNIAIRTLKPKQPYAWKCVDVAIGFQNQNMPYLAIGRKIARFTAFRGNLRQTYFMFKTWLQLELGCSNFASDLSWHYIWDILNINADRGNLRRWSTTFSAKCLKTTL